MRSWLARRIAPAAFADVERQIANLRSGIRNLEVALSSARVTITSLSRANREQERSLADLQGQIEARDLVIAGLRASLDAEDEARRAAIHRLARKVEAKRRAA